MVRKYIRPDKLNPPSPNGRNPVTGRWEMGNPGGPGNPHAARVSQLRSAMVQSCTPESVVKVMHAIFRKAIRTGDVPAATFISRVFSARCRTQAALKPSPRRFVPMIGSYEPQNIMERTKPFGPAPAHYRDES